MDGRSKGLCECVGDERGGEADSHQSRVCVVVQVYDSKKI